MGQKDFVQNQYFENNLRFADICNGILFYGESIIKANELEESDSVFVQLFEKNQGKKLTADKVKKWKGQHIAILSIESQSYVDYRMVLRVMMEEVMAYEKQRESIFSDLKESGYQFQDNEYVSKMKKEQKLLPVIPIVLYLGTDNEWDAATSLYEILDMDESLKPFVNNYRLNIYDYHKETDFSRFKTENRYLFEILSNRNNKEKLIRIFEDASINHNLDSYSAELMLQMADVKYDVTKLIETKEGKKVYNVCKAIDDLKQEAREEGYELGKNDGYKSGTDDGYKSGMNDGYKSGRNEGALHTLVELYKKHHISLDIAATTASMTPEEFLVIVN